MKMTSSLPIQPPVCLVADPWKINAELEFMPVKILDNITVIECAT
jgi:hypothetical protein